MSSSKSNMPIKGNGQEDKLQPYYIFYIFLYFQMNTCVLTAMVVLCTVAYVSASGYVLPAKGYGYGYGYAHRPRYYAGKYF